MHNYNEKMRNNIIPKALAAVALITCIPLLLLHPAREQHPQNLLVKHDDDVDAKERYPDSHLSKPDHGPFPDCVSFTEEEICDGENVCMTDLVTDKEAGTDRYKLYDDFRTRFRSKQYNISYCRIFKCASTLMRVVMQFLEAPNHFLENGQLMGPNSSISYDDARTFITLSQSMERQISSMADGLNETRWKHFAVIREPLDRFMASWYFLCVKRRDLYEAELGHCFDCGANIECFVRNFTEFIRVSRTWAYPRYFAHIDHFWPLSWYCNFKDHLDKYTIIYNDPSNRTRFIDDVTSFFEAAGVPASLLSWLRETGLREEIDHTHSHGLPFQVYKNKLRRRPELLKSLIRVFHVDYKMFGLHLPCF